MLYTWIFYDLGLSYCFVIYFLLGMQLPVHDLMGFFCFVEGGMPIVLWVIYSDIHFVILLN